MAKKEQSNPGLPETVGVDDMGDVSAVAAVPADVPVDMPIADLPAIWSYLRTKTGAKAAFFAAVRWLLWAGNKFIPDDANSPPVFAAAGTMAAVARADMGAASTRFGGPDDHDQSQADALVNLHAALSGPDAGKLGARGELIQKWLLPLLTNVIQKIIADWLNKVQPTA
jgi:hypothetical protein